MKKHTYLITAFMLIALITHAETETPYSEEQIHELKAIEYFEYKHLKKAKKDLEDLQKSIDKYKRGIAKLTKNSKTYHKRVKELKDMQNLEKATKILLLYPSIHKKAIDAYLKNDFSNFQKNTKIRVKLMKTYKELTQKNFPSIMNEYNNYKKRKSPNKTSKKRQASTQ